MFKLKKLNAFFITLFFSSSIFSNSSMAVVVSGSVSAGAAESHFISSVLMADKQQILNGVDSVVNTAVNLDITSQPPTLHSVDVAQHSPLLPSASVYDNLVGYAGLETSGIANRTEYHGWMISELTAVEVNEDDVVTVPEPSPVLLLLGPLLFLLWRLNVLPEAFRRFR